MTSLDAARRFGRRSCWSARTVAAPESPMRRRWSSCGRSTRASLESLTVKQEPMVAGAAECDGGDGVADVGGSVGAHRRHSRHRGRRPTPRSSCRASRSTSSTSTPTAAPRIAAPSGSTPRRSRAAQSAQVTHVLENVAWETGDAYSVEVRTADPARGAVGLPGVREGSQVTDPRGGRAVASLTDVVLTCRWKISAPRPAPASRSLDDRMQEQPPAAGRHGRRGELCVYGKTTLFHERIRVSMSEATRVLHRGDFFTAGDHPPAGGERPDGGARQAGGDPARGGRAPRARARPDRGRARRRQDHAGPGAREVARPRVPAHPVHQRPAAVRHHRRLDLSARERALRVLARAAVRQRRARRRDQPRHAEDPVGAARGDERAAGLGRPPALRAARAVLRARDAEPARVPGHVPAARVAARPLPDVARARLSAARRRARAAALGRRRRHPRAAWRRWSTATSCVELQRRVAGVRVADKLADYILTLAEATRRSEEFALGVSTARRQDLFRAAQAMALCEGRDFAVPDDVQRTAPHRCCRIASCCAPAAASRWPAARCAA